MLRLVSLALVAVLAGCGKAPSTDWQGYVEGEFVLLASPYAGQLQKLYMRRGERAEVGKPVFVLEQENERAARLQAEAQLAAAEARLLNLRAARRMPEIDAQRAELAEAHAALAYSTTELARQEKLFREKFVSEAAIDTARTIRDRDAARVKSAESQLKNLLQPVGRDDERKAAEGEVAAAKAAVAQAVWRLEQKSVAAPVAGMVQDTFFVEGEWVPAGRPVASILPPANVKIRFYVPEPSLSSVKTGGDVQIGCDGCPQPIAGKISYVSSQAEYTPPVLYSKESRYKLMFLVEARASGDNAAVLRPGQPIDVRLGGREMSGK